MTSKPISLKARAAFTLVELLVVMGIIAILVSLLSGAVFVVLKRVDEVNTQQDIRQMEAAVQSFQGQYSVEYIPSQIILCEIKDDYYADAPLDTTFKSQLHQDSFQYLMRVWPRLNWGGTPPNNTPLGGTAWAGIDWNGDGQPSPDVLLEGDQCLVFFLGGMNGDMGFSTNGANPAQNPNANPTQGWGPSGSRVAPFFEFKTKRLVSLHPASPTYPSYIDPYGKMPYAYFSSYKVRNGYNRYGTTDCPSLGNPSLGLPPPSPYNDGQNYYNAETCQIISAGRNKLFGPGGLWAPGSIAAGQPGADDMSNFYTKLLGLP
jgi:prepilin-type N-terminal cleavage/methylation domain-containing protein